MSDNHLTNNDLLLNLKTLAFQIKKEYKDYNSRENQKTRTLEEYLLGLNWDIGTLNKLVTWKLGYRSIENVDEAIKHELADCLWALIIISDELWLDLFESSESSFGSILKQIKQ